MRLGCVGDWTVPESWSHVIGIMLRAVDEIVSAVRMSRIRVLCLLVGVDLGKLQRRRLFDYGTKEVLEDCATDSRTRQFIDELV